MGPCVMHPLIHAYTPAFPTCSRGEGNGEKKRKREAGPTAPGGHGLHRQARRDGGRQMRWCSGGARGGSGRQPEWLGTELHALVLVQAVLGGRGTFGGHSVTAGRQVGGDGWEAQGRKKRSLGQRQ